MSPPHQVFCLWPGLLPHVCTSRHPRPLPPRKVNSTRREVFGAVCARPSSLSRTGLLSPAGTCLMSQKLGPASLGRMGVWRGSQTSGSSLAPLTASLPGTPSQLPFPALLLTGTWPLLEAPVAGHTLLVLQRTHAVAPCSCCSPGGLALSTGAAGLQNRGPQMRVLSPGIRPVGEDHEGPGAGDQGHL